jgi:hypothetical protein
MIPAIAAASNDPSRRAMQHAAGGEAAKPGQPLNEFSGDINGLMTFW